MEVRRKVAEVSFRKAMKSHEICRNSLALLLHNTVSYAGKIAAPFLEFSGEAGTLRTTCYLSGGKYHLTINIQLVSWPPLSFNQLEFLVINDRHDQQFQVPLDKGEYNLLKMNDVHEDAAAGFVIFLMAFHLVCLGYFLDLLKSILIPSKMVPYLGFSADSSREVFHFIPQKS